MIDNASFLMLNTPEEISGECAHIGCLKPVEFVVYLSGETQPTRQKFITWPLCKLCPDHYWVEYFEVVSPLLLEVVKKEVEGHGLTINTKSLMLNIDHESDHKPENHE